MTNVRVVNADLALTNGVLGDLSMTQTGRLRVEGGAGSGGPLPAGTDRSGSITAGGTAQQMAPANASRTALKGQNISAGDLWINENTGTATSAAPNAPGSYKVASGATFSIQTNKLVSVYGATTGQAWTATES